MRNRSVSPPGGDQKHTGNDQLEADCRKLELDLTSVQEKVTLYVDLIAAGLPRGDETLLEVVSFLEACRERMPDIIEAGTQGYLTEELFAQALRVNDAVLQILEADKNGTIPPPSVSQQPASAAASSAGNPNPPKSSFSLLDLEEEQVAVDFFAMKPPSAAASPASNVLPNTSQSGTRTQGAPHPVLPLAAAVGEDSSPNGSQRNPLLAQQMPLPDHRPPPVPVDDFDDFLLSLTSKK